MNQAVSPAFRKAIFLTQDSPYPANTNARHRETHLIELLRERMEVELLCFDTRSIEDVPSTIQADAIARKRQPLWRRATYPLQSTVVNGYCDRMEEALRARAHPGTILWVSRLSMAKYIPLARELGYRIILDEQSVESNTHMDQAFSSVKSLPGFFKAAQTTFWEGRFCMQANAIVATSELDSSRLAKLVPRASVIVIPNSIDAGLYDDVRQVEGTTLFFTGSFDWEPNEIGLIWFIDEVLPRLRRGLGHRLPRIVVAGSKPTPALKRKLQHTGIDLKLDVPSTLPLLADSGIVFIPIRSGAGAVHRVLEAMSCGRAVVSTGKGVEGLVLAPGYDVYVSENADGFTSAIAKLVLDPALRKDVGDNAARTISQRFDWRVARETIGTLLTRLAADDRRGKNPTGFGLSALMRVSFGRALKERRSR